MGFCNTTPLPNYHNFFSNAKTKYEIDRRVKLFKARSSIKGGKIETISPYSVLKIAEIIFSDPKILEDNENMSEDEELGLFKAFLVLNGEYNTFNHNFNEDDIEGFINFHILHSFQLFELSLYNDDIHEFSKLLYVTIFKVEELLSFLNADHLLPIKNDLLQSFNVLTEDQLLYEMKYLFGLLIYGKRTNRFIYDLNLIEKLDLLENLTLEQISADEDFTDLKKFPIYRLDESTISVINYYYTIDLFYRSAKFRIKEIYHAEGYSKNMETFSATLIKAFRKNIS